MVQQWKKVSEKIAFANRWRQFDLWDMQREDGQTGEFVIERGGNVVIVFAMTEDQRVLTIREFYFGPQEVSLGLVGGFIENNDPAETAKKELREETGYVSDRWSALGYAWRGKYTTGKVYMFLAEAIYSAGLQQLEQTESIEMEFYPLDQFIQLLRSGKFHCADEIMVSHVALDHLKLLSYES